MYVKRANLWKKQSSSITTNRCLISATCPQSCQMKINTACMLLLDFDFDGGHACPPFHPSLAAPRTLPRSNLDLLHPPPPDLGYSKMQATALGLSCADIRLLNTAAVMKNSTPE